MGVALTTTTTTTTEMPSHFRCPENYGYYPNPSDCTSYYQCVGWIPYQFNCQPGLAYNPNAQACDWAYNVPGCNGAAKSVRHLAAKNDDPEATDINLGEVTDFVCPGNGVYPADDCDQYYTCYENSPVYKWKCRSNFLFDLTYNGCNYPEQTECGDRNRPGGAPTVPPTPPTTPPGFVCPRDGFFPLTATSCSRDYYTCVDNVAYPETCPSIGIFDPDRLHCSQPATVVCTTVTTVSTTSSSGSFTCPGEGSYANPMDCGSYYVCVNGIPSMIDCPSGLYYNMENGVCDFPDNVVCNTSVVFRRGRRLY